MADEGEEPNEDSGPPMRCNPGAVTRLILKLSPEMVESIEKFKLTKMLNMKLTGLAYNRKTCGDLMDKSFVHE
jgi:hypothetical protein